MANGINASKNHLRDWLAKRPLSTYISRSKKTGMKFWKRLLHKKERSLAKKYLNDQLNK